MFSVVGECFLLVRFSFARTVVLSVNSLPNPSAMAIMVYALYTYHWRAASIRRGGRGPYDDRFGPVSFVSMWAPLHDVLNQSSLS